MGRSLPTALVLAVLFVSAVATGQTRMRQAEPGEKLVVLYPDWSLTDEGQRRIAETLDRQVRELEKLRAENTSLRVDITKASERPALTFAGVALLMGGGFVLGALVAIPVALAVRR